MIFKYSKQHLKICIFPLLPVPVNNEMTGNVMLLPVRRVRQCPFFVSIAFVRVPLHHTVAAYNNNMQKELQPSKSCETTMLCHLRVKPLAESGSPHTKKNHP